MKSIFDRLVLFTEETGSLRTH